MRRRSDPRRRQVLRGALHIRIGRVRLVGGIIRAGDGDMDAERQRDESNSRSKRRAKPRHGRPLPVHDDRMR
ncbi:hypothetical protein BLN97_38545 [Bradyrhizobium elkanii]|nr:hypothetical protein BLN97_38545 [Bradyrhizobium elkanii]